MLAIWPQRAGERAQPGTTCYPDHIPPRKSMDNVLSKWKGASRSSVWTVQGETGLVTSKTIPGPATVGGSNDIRHSLWQIDMPGHPPGMPLRLAVLCAPTHLLRPPHGADVEYPRGWHVPPTTSEHRSWHHRSWHRRSWHSSCLAAQSYPCWRVDGPGVWKDSGGFRLGVLCRQTVTEEESLVCGLSYQIASINSSLCYAHPTSPFHTSFTGLLRSSTT